MIHKLKIDTQFFNDVWECKKTAEMRKYDRNFNVGDRLILCEYINKKFTGNRVYCDITHILVGTQYGIIDGFCMLSFKLILRKFHD